MKHTARVLLVDDDETFRRVMSAELTRRGHKVTATASADEALALAVESEPEVILLDLRLPEKDGIFVLQKLRDAEVPAGVVVLTGHGTIDTAIQAMRLGAYDYLEKPCPLEKVDMAIQKASEHLRLVARQRVLEDGYTPPKSGREFVGKSPAYQKVVEAVGRIAPTDWTTLIQGETGAGKEMVASLVHAQSRRAEKPFVVVDCAALHENLLQTELFGHEKGAFTGATRQKHGLFEVANGGTIFLDEVGDISPEVQGRLLRVLETGCFRRLGGTRETAVDVRVISATNRNLREATSKGHFREDLYYRLSPLTIEIPPLRERREDIRMLVEHFTREFNRQFDRSRSFSEEAMGILVRYRWPGNVRELIHVVGQVMVLSDKDLITPEDLPPGLQASAAGPGNPAPENSPTALREVVRSYVFSILARESGNRPRTARILQISERTLYRLLKKYGPQPAPARTGS